MRKNLVETCFVDIPYDSPYRSTTTVAWSKSFLFVGVSVHFSVVVGVQWVGVG